MNKTYYGSPEPISTNPDIEDNYIHALCKCPLPTTYTVKIPRSWSKNGVYNFHCKECGTEGIVLVKEKYGR